MKSSLRLIGYGLTVIILAGIAFYLWASWASSRALSRQVETHVVDFPIPFPLEPEERAVERGRHLVQARYGCRECHGSDFGGGVMVDAFPIGTLLGPNLTKGAGSVTLDYTPAAWDRIVRHGVRQDGTASTMPAQDFQRMSDRELSDIVAYIRSLPPVDREVPPVRLGPLGKILVATGRLPLAPEVIASHTTPHAAEPPAAEATPEFGAHLAGTCTGCHGEDLSGGPIVGGDPSWPPATNLTPHPEGLGPWTYEDFVTAMREGERPDGATLRPPMAQVLPMAQRMGEVELRALWTYLRSLPPVAGPS